MPRINLLPWREERRTQQRTEYLIVLGICGVLAGAVWFGIHLYFNELIKQQERRNGFLQEQIVLLDKKIKQIKELEREKESLIARMKAIETLQTSRPIIVHLFDELVNTLPEGVYVTDVSQKDKEVTIQGVAQSNARVSNYMRNVESSEWVKDPKLSIITSAFQAGRRLANFTMKLKQSAPTPPVAEGEEEL